MGVGLCEFESHLGHKKKEVVFTTSFFYFPAMWCVVVPTMMAIDIPSLDLINKPNKPNKSI